MSAAVRKVAAGCLSKLTPAQRERVLARIEGGGGGWGERLSTYSWTDLTYLLHKANVSWAYYVQSGIQPDQHDHARPGLGLHRDLPGLG
jgi:hypothetical protein